MRDRTQIVEAFESLCREGKSAALATVVSVEGSSYRHPGARMLVAADGRTWGTISGGCLERDVARRARMLIAEPSQPTVICYETDEEDIGEKAARPVLDPGPSLGCGGRIEILLERVTAADPGALAAIAAVVRGRIPAAVATVIRVGSTEQSPVFAGMKLVQIGAGAADGDVSDPILRDEIVSRLQGDSRPLRRFDVHRHKLTGGGWAEVLFERIAPSQALAIFGDGQDVAALVDIASTLGWHVTVIGARPEAGLREKFPRASVWICAPNDPASAAANLPPETAAVIMAHNFRRDTAALAALLLGPRRYIGVLGPRRRTARLLNSAGFAGDLHRIHSPVGLDIGGDSSEEIALSIAAEIQAVTTRREAGFLRDRDGPIHLEHDEQKNAGRSARIDEEMNRPRVR